MLTLLIPGRSQVPFEYFDVWIRPLIDELKDLWEGVPAYDVLKPEGQRVFKLRAAVLYTTHDFPGYGTVSGAAHQGYVACPPCGDQLRGKYAYESRKITYRDARRWVRPDHYIRSRRYDKLFDGLPETRLAPTAKTPAQQLAALHEYHAYLSRRREGRSRHAECRVQSTETDEGRLVSSGIKNMRASTSSLGRVGTPSSSIPNHDQLPSPVTSRNRKRKASSGSASASIASETASKLSHRSLVGPGRSRSKQPATRREKTPDPSKIYGIKRGSSFFELPYWEVSFFAIIM